MCGLIWALISAAGCFNSESDYEQLVQEKEVLAAELATATRENEILTQALENIKQEQENLQILLNTSRSNLAAAGSAGAGSSPTLPPLSGDAPAFSWGGWDWTPPPDAFDPPAQSETPAPSREKIYRPKPGDTLYTIARHHGTTLETLLELNPYLQQRRNYMIRDTDKIKLP